MRTKISRINYESSSFLWNCQENVDFRRISGNAFRLNNTYEIVISQSCCGASKMRLPHLLLLLSAICELSFLCLSNRSFTLLRFPLAIWFFLFYVPSPLIANKTRLVVFVIAFSVFFLVFFFFFKFPPYYHHHSVGSLYATSNLGMRMSEWASGGGRAGLGPLFSERSPTNPPPSDFSAPLLVCREFSLPDLFCLY